MKMERHRLKVVFHRGIICRGKKLSNSGNGTDVHVGIVLQSILNILVIIL